MALAHLQVNGDSSSLLLFGGLLVWSAVEVVIINEQAGKPPLDNPDLSLLRECIAIGASLIMHGVTAYVQGWLGQPLHG